MIQILSNKVLVLPETIKETTKSGIILTQMQAEIPTRGTIVSVGKKVEELKEGDYVMYQPTHAILLHYEDKEYLMFPESSIIAKIN